MLQQSSYEIIFNSQVKIFRKTMIELNGDITGRILNEVIHEKMNSE